MDNTMANEFNSFKAKFPPAGYYRFTSGALTTDSSAGAHTLSAVTTPIDGTPKFGASVGTGTADGFSAYDHSDFKPTGSFSISAWVKTTSTGTAKFIFQSFSSNTNVAGFYFRKSAANKLYFVSGKNTGTVLGTDWQQITGSTSINDGEWHFVVATWDGSYFYLYLDGVSDATPIAWAFAPGYAATNYISIASSNLGGAPGSYWNGALDDVALWNGKSLSPSEITTLNGAELNTVPSLLGDASLKAYYRFEDGALTIDTTANAHTLTTLRYPIALTSKFNGFVYFQTTSGYSAVDHDDFKPTGNFTIGAWIKTSSTTTLQSIFASYSANTNTAGISLSVATNNGMVLRSAKNTGTTANVDYKLATGGTIITDGNWHFVVGTWNGTTLSLYLDGKVDGTPVAWANAPVYAATNYPRIGCLNNSGTNVSFFGGSLDDVFLLNGRALTLEEIQEIYFTTYNLVQETGYAILQETGYKILLDGREYFQNTKSLKYTVFITPTGINKSLKYAIVTTPTAQTKSLKYTVKTSATAIQKSLKYTVLTTILGDTKDLTYIIVTLNTISKTLRYKVLTTPTAKSKSLKYGVIKIIPVTKQMVYDVSAPVAVTKSLKYTVPTTKTPVDKTLVYDIVSPVGIAKTLKYCIVFTAPIMPLTYLLQESGDYLLQETGYKIILNVNPSIDVPLTYRILTLPAGISKSLHYAIVSPVSVPKTLKYVVWSTPTGITKSLKYGILTTPAATTKTLKYVTTITIPALTKALKYTVKAPLGITKSLKYTVLTTKTAITKVLRYLIRNEIVVTKTLKYTVVVPLVVTKSLKYTVWTTKTPKTLRMDYRIILDAEVTELYHPVNTFWTGENNEKARAYSTTYTYYYHTESRHIIGKSLTYAVV